LKKSAYVRQGRGPDAWLLRQMIQGTNEIGCAGIGPATSSGLLRFASAAVLSMSPSTPDTKGGSLTSGNASSTAEHPARPIQIKTTKARTRSTPPGKVSANRSLRKSNLKCANTKRRQPTRAYSYISLVPRPRATVEQPRQQ
jgi:hypothetical protein